MNVRATVVGMVALVAAGTADGAVVLVSQNRSVSASGTVSGPGGSTNTDSGLAPGYGPFADTASASGPIIPGGPPGSSTGSSSQTSDVSTSALSAQLGASTSRTGTAYSASASSMYSVVFNVTDAPVQVLITGSALPAPGSDQASASASLSGVFSWFASLGTNTWAAPLSATLPVGQYTFSAGVSAANVQSSFPSSSNANITLTFVPAPGAGAAGLGVLALAARRRRGV